MIERCFISHIAQLSAKPGQPMFKDMEALTMACTMLGLEIVQTNKYNWFNRSVGDYPLPEGVKAADLGKNAEFILRITAAKKEELMAGPRGSFLRSNTPYDIGMIKDPNNPGCFVPAYDYFVGGYGLDEVVGPPQFSDSAKRNVTALCPKLKNTYDMCCDKLAAQKSGDKIEFLTWEQAYAKYPDRLPNPTSEAKDTWVSIALPSEERMTVPV